MISQRPSPISCRVPSRRRRPAVRVRSFGRDPESRCSRSKLKTLISGALETRPYPRQEVGVALNAQAGHRGSFTAGSSAIVDFNAFSYSSYVSCPAARCYAQTRVYASYKPVNLTSELSEGPEPRQLAGGITALR
jgi:hypothetical protein